jgi:hypothetical protein
VLSSIFTSDSEFRQDLEAINGTQQWIERLVNQVATIEQQDALRSIRDDLEQLKQPLSRIEQSFEGIAQAINRSEQEKVLDWASSLPYEKYFAIVENKAGKHSELTTTGSWLFEDNGFKHWQNSSSSQILWLRGGAGTGKSTLA